MLNTEVGRGRGEPVKRSIKAASAKARTSAGQVRAYRVVRYGLATVLVVCAVLGAAQVVSLTRCPNRCAAAGSGSADTAAAVAAPALVTINQGPNARDVDPLAPVSVSAASGTLSGVRMVNEAGTSIAGVMTPDSTVWHPVVPLG